jgi:hypothetical protein
VTQQASATVPAGSVISQDPVAGTSVAAGSAVDLTVSTGPASVSVPDVVGLTQSAATTAITNAGLVVGTVTQQASATVPAGSVISQDPVAGTSVAAGSAVDLTVSSGTPTTVSGSVAPSALAFGNWARNSTSTGQSVTVTNTGTGTLPITSITLTGSHPGQFSRSTDCPSQLAVGASCTVTVVFRPTSTGNKSANLVAALGSGAGNLTVALTGTGVNYKYTVQPNSLSFGNVASGTTSATRSVTIKNTSSVALPLASVALGGSSPGQFTLSHTCPAQLPAGATCSASVQFRPTSTGTKSATLIVAPGNGAASKSVALSGTGA